MSLRLFAKIKFLHKLPNLQKLSSEAICHVYNYKALTSPGFHDRVPTSSGNHGKPDKLLKKFHAWKNHGIR